MYEMIKLLVIGLPIAIILLCTANLFFEIKRIIQWKSYFTNQTTSQR